MKNISLHIGKLEIIEKLPNSKNGNPRYKVEIDGWIAVTKPDCSLGYKITNYNGLTVRATIGSYYGVRTVNTVHKVA